jgi:MYXO-CTERM domain-containing protein
MIGAGWVVAGLALLATGRRRRRPRPES